MNIANLGSVEAPEHVNASIAQQMTERTPTLQGLLPSDVSWREFQAGVWSEFLRRDTLNACTEKSITAAILDAAQAGMVPGLHCHLLPFKKTCTYVQNYQGLCLELDRTGRVSESRAEPVYQHDRFVCDELAGKFAFEREWGPDRGPIKCYVAWIRLKGEERPIVRPMHLADVDKVRRMAPGGEQDAWLKWPEAMGAKTALKKLKKYVTPAATDTEETMAAPDYAALPPGTNRTLELCGDQEGAAEARQAAIRGPRVKTAPPASEDILALWTEEEHAELGTRMAHILATEPTWPMARFWLVWHEGYPNAHKLSDLPADYLRAFLDRFDRDAVEPDPVPAAVEPDPVPADAQAT